MKKLIYRICIY